MGSSNSRRLKIDSAQGLYALHDYITNGKAERNVTGWTRYKNTTPGPTPEVNPGGSPTVLSAPTRSTTSPLYKNGATIEMLKSAANGQGEGYYTDIEISKIDEGKVMEVVTDYYVALATYVGGVSSDLMVFVADLDNGVFLTTNGYQLSTASSVGTRVVTTFTSVNATGGANSRKYRIFLHHSSTSANSFTVRFNMACRVKVTPVTTKGDLYVYSSSAGSGINKEDRLPVGTNGQVLMADSAQAAGVKWAAAAASSTPTVQRFTSGSGTYTTPANVKWIKVRLAGGGGGGSGGGTSARGGGTNGGNTTFGTSLLTAGGGSAGPGGPNTAGGAGGGATVNSPAIAVVSLTGGQGGGNSVIPSSFGGSTGYGGANPFGGGGANPPYAAGGTNSGTNGTGAGGGGGYSGGLAGEYCGSGGGAGAYIEAIITSPSASYSYSVGAGGSGGTAASTAGPGYAGGSGILIVEEYYI